MISANLPFHWVEDPEVQVLFSMFRSLAGTVIPLWEVLSERLLDEEYERVTANVKKQMEGKYVTLS